MKLSNYEELINEYHRISSRISNMPLDMDLSQADKKKLTMSLKKRLNILLHKIREIETEV
jgi:hypothetical protein|tara:strand:- start:454 stop:633 length:180 start_codon:yes stop_codon:yes gene_type:complete